MKTCDILFRRATLEDDVSAIAKYIYLTDPFIYPAIADTPEDKEWIELINQCYKAPDNLFSSQNIFLALVNEQIVGVCCIIPCGKRHKFVESVEIRNTTLLRINDVNNRYFEPLLKESAELDGYNVVNLCVDSRFRNMGIGKGLLNYSINSCEAQTIYLDVISDNNSAINVYKALGFEIVKSYEGFALCNKSVMCYQMKASRGGLISKN